MLENGTKRLFKNFKKKKGDKKEVWGLKSPRGFKSRTPVVSEPQRKLPETGDKYGYTCRLNRNTVKNTKYANPEINTIKTPLEKMLPMTTGTCPPLVTPLLQKHIYKHSENADLHQCLSSYHPYTHAPSLLYRMWYTVYAAEWRHLLRIIMHQLQGIVHKGSI